MKNDTPASPITVVSRYDALRTPLDFFTLLPDEIRLVNGGEHVGNSDGVFKDTAAFLVNQRLNEDDDEPVVVTLIFVDADDPSAVITYTGSVKSWNEEMITKFDGTRISTRSDITFADGMVITDDRLLSVTL